MGRRIIIADDEPITRMNISELLIEAGYDVVGEANDGFDAVELCKKHHPDLIILDVKMPLLDGLMAAKIINDENLADGIVLLTAYSGREFTDKAKECGVINYIVKPISEKSFLLSVEFAINEADEHVRLKKYGAEMCEKLEARVLIDRAKSYLIKTMSQTEDEAYCYIRKLSMEKRCSMKEISKVLLMDN